MSEGGFENGAGRKPHGLAPHFAAEDHNAFVVSCPHVAKAHHELGGNMCGGTWPVRLEAQHVSGVGRREARRLHQSLALERGDGALCRGGHRHLADGNRALAHHVENFPLARVEFNR